MKYLCMVFLDEGKLTAMSKEELQELDDVSLAFDESLRQGNHLLAAQALQGVATAVTIRRSGGKTVVTDGPFAETKEQIGGFILIEAGDMNEAIQLASSIPVGQLGPIEVRPIKELVASPAQQKKTTSSAG
ncbi:MAG: YciI family protein [Bryobacteraceae bacterium]